jgi:glutamate N-acetyltransferase/amino-acid N-acetyltransferase
MQNTPKGYKFAVHAAGFKKAGKLDLALVLSDTPATAAAMFTTNLFKAAPVIVGQELLAKNRAFRAVVVNSGQANASTGEQGILNCRRTLELIARAAKIQPEEILPASTGVIGSNLKMDIWEKAAPLVVAELGKHSVEDFSRAIMTTDRFHKVAFAEFVLRGKSVRLCGIAKGAGMICPNMATMLSVLLCDAKVEDNLWKKLAQQATNASFNRVSVDGDTSTNDTLYALANGASGAEVKKSDASKLLAAMTDVLKGLAYMLVQDGEGATKVMHIKISGAKTRKDAEKAARVVGHSQLVKTAMFGQDANWGRIIAALGRSGAIFNPDEVVLKVCRVLLFKNGGPVNTSGKDDPALVKALKERDILIEVEMGRGSGKYEFLASDLTHDYVTINADYRS